TPNPEITWEKALTYNAGIDANFLDNKLSFSVEGFKKHTYDILGSRIASMPTTFGASMPQENYAIIDAKGFEVEIGYTNKAGDFNYIVKGNLGYATNKLIMKDQAENIRAYQSEIGFNIDRSLGLIYTDIIRTQEQLDAILAKNPDYTVFGRKPGLGMMNYQDLRGPNSDEPDGKIDANDQDWIMNHTTPPVNYGFLLGGSWKGISLDLFFSGVHGKKLMISTKWVQTGIVASNYAFWNDHWTPENPNALFPRVADNELDRASTFWMKNASFLRLKNVNLAYTLPKSLLSKLKVKQAKVFFTGTNLFLLEDHVKYHDPENTAINNYPLMKSYSLGLNFSF
ncbi:MAG: TonB-dependent receptor, partial [Candidatus Symbiothrix sp.]|nr:TonB-dependent receptor [Candidatus Symbiothrix sp.]